jgi:hypothetical protein
LQDLAKERRAVRRDDVHSALWSLEEDDRSLLALPIGVYDYVMQPKVLRHSVHDQPLVG